MKAHFSMMARYNAWANERLYAMAGTLSDELFKRNVGAYFKSLHGTLNHLLVADRIWMRRLTGEGEHPNRLDAILFDDFLSLQTARTAEDQRILSYVEALQDGVFAQAVEFRTTKGVPMSQPLGELLAHVFNHQTHHRGQAHAILTSVGVHEPEPLDLLVMTRSR